MQYATALGLAGFSIFLLSSVLLMITLAIYQRSDAQSNRFEKALSLFCLTGLVGLILLVPHFIVVIFF